jgi:hypothetical protein
MNVRSSRILSVNALVPLTIISSSKPKSSAGQRQPQQPSPVAGNAGHLFFVPRRPVFWAEQARQRFSAGRRRNSLCKMAKVSRTIFILSRPRTRLTRVAYSQAWAWIGSSRKRVP